MKFHSASCIRRKKSGDASMGFMLNQGVRPGCWSTMRIFPQAWCASRMPGGICDETMRNRIGPEHGPFVQQPPQKMLS
jgi:hypothetical protein